MRKFLLALSSVFVFVPSALSLIITDGSGIAGGHGITYVVSWTDQYNKLRVCELYKGSTGYGGTVPHIQYYTESGSPVNILPNTPGDSAWNSTFGATVHHGGSFSGGGTFTKRYQGNHIAIFDLVQNLGGAIEIVTYTFMDGHDYFQWAETVDTRLGTQQADSRGPYTDMNWDGIDFSYATNIDYGMNGYFNMTQTGNSSDAGGHATLYGNFTVTGYLNASRPNGNVDIPYCREQCHGREIGYIQSQTYVQQLAGDNTWYQSANIGINRPDNGTQITTNNDWMFDTQMNFFDGCKKITWGTPLGFMNHSNPPASDAIGRLNNGDKGQWGQYSLSCVLDSVAQGGVMRVRNENRAVQSNQFTVTASIGTLKLEGPVGTSNVNNRQTLAPAGWDHNYRTWWAYPDATQKLQLTISGNNGTSIVNPTFRIRNMSALPTLVQFNAATLVDGADYYADLIPDTTAASGVTNEVWITLKKAPFGANNNLAFNMQGTGGGGSIIPETGGTFNQPYVYSFKSLTITNGITAVFPSGFAASDVTFTGTAGSPSFTNALMTSNCIGVYQFTSSLDYSEKPVRFSLLYDPKLIPSDRTESQIVLYFYNGVEWVKVAGDLDQVNNLFKFQSNKLSGTYYLFVSDPNKIDTGTTPDKKPDMSQWSYNPFSPNEDGSADTTRMEVQLTSASKVSLEIFNRDHGLVRTLLNEQKLTGKTYVEWDGKNSQGKIVAPGAYIYILKINSVIRKGVIVVAY